MHASWLFGLLLLSTTPPAPSTVEAATLAPLGPALAQLPEVRGWAWSGTLPQSEAGFAAFVQARQQWTIASSASRLRQRWGRQLGFDPLDAAGLRRFGLRPEPGSWLVQLGAGPAPIVVCSLADEAAFRRQLTQSLEEDEGPGKLEQARTRGGLVWTRAQRRFGRSVRDAGGYARLPQACGADWVALAAPGSEQDLAHLVDLLHAAAGAGACAAPARRGAAGATVPWTAPLGATTTVWLRHPPHAPRAGATTVQLAFAAEGVDVAVHALPGVAIRTTGAADAHEADLLPAGAGAGTAPLAQVYGARRGPGLAQLTAAAPNALREAGIVLPQPALRRFVEDAARPFDEARRPALRPLARALTAHDGPFWLRLEPTAKSAAGLQLGWAAATRLDGPKAAATLAEGVRQACAARPAAEAGQGAAPVLRCSGRIDTARGPATLLAVEATGRLGEAPLQLAAVDRWLLAASDAAALRRLLASVPPSGAGVVPGDAKPNVPGGVSANASAPPQAAPAAALALAPAALRAVVEPPQAAGELDLAVAADLLQGALLPPGAGALAQGPLGILPQLLLAGPLGDALRELSALGHFDFALRHDANEVWLAGRLAPPNARRGRR